MDLKQLIKETAQNLPEDLQKAVLDKNLPERILEIAEKNGLNELQTEILKNEVYFVILGIERASYFQKNLDGQMGVGTEKSIKIAGDVYREIFEPIEITLMAIEEIEDREAREEKINRGRQAFEETLKSTSPEVPQTNENYSVELAQPEKLGKKDESDKYDISVFENMASKTVKPDLIKKRYGIEPAKDLGAEDFRWQGKISGVEIDDSSKNGTEQDVDEQEKTEEDLDKNQVLSEIEYPPAYVPKSFSDKIDKTVYGETEKKEVADGGSNGTEENGYKGRDPYRETIE